MSTYVVDKEGKFIPATQRPDGTWRKARRVKNGYVPQEEVPLYESKGKQFAQRKPVLPPGFYVVPAEKLHNKKGAVCGIICTHKQQTIPGVIKLPANIDTTTINTNTTSRTSLTTIATTQPHSTVTTTRTKTAANSNNNYSGNSSGQKLKHSKSIHINHTIDVRDHCADDISDKLKDQLQLNDEMHVDIQKKLKKLRKKLREIEQLEEKMRNGTLKTPDKDQLNKVKRKKEIQKELKTLEAEQEQSENEMDKQKKEKGALDSKKEHGKALTEETI